jgi:hypothetical protein
VVTKKAKSYRAKESGAMGGVRVGWQPMQFVCRIPVVGSNPLNLCMAALLLFLLSGCAASQPVLNLGAPQAVAVPDKTGLRHTYSYVAIKSGSSLLDHTMGFSIYDEDAKHILTNVTPIQGFLGAVGEAATQSAVPTASFVGPLIK